MVSKEVDHPALINIDNWDWEKEVAEGDEAQAGNLFFESVMSFKDTFTKNLPMHVRDRVHSITLKTDFNNLPSQGSREDVQNKLCNQAFAQLNIKETVHIKF